MPPPLLVRSVNGYYALGPERSARWARAAWQRLREGGVRAASWAKGVRWRDPESMLEVHF